MACDINIKVRGYNPRQALGTYRPWGQKVKLGIAVLVSAADSIGLDVNIFLIHFNIHF